VPTVWKRISTRWRKPRPESIRPFAKVRLGIDVLEDRVAPAVNVLSFHNDSQSWGVNSDETILTPSNVKTSTFGKQFSVPLDGETYAQPLVATNISIVDGPNTSVGATGIHDVVYVATENDSVYAIDTANGAILWKRSFLDTTAEYIGAALGTNINNSLGATGANGSAITTIPWYDTGSDVITYIGITGTPVIDLAAGAMYVNVNTKQNLPGGIGWVQQLHAISLSDGTDKLNPYTLGVNQGDNNNTTSIYSNGTGDGSVAGIVKFNALRELHRGAISFVNGQIYLQFASHGDNGPYHGWVVKMNAGATDFALTGVLNTSPNNGLSGIWMSGGKLSFELDGSAFYFETGNGSGGAPTLDAQGFPTNANYNEAVVKVVNDPTTTVDNQNSNGWGMKVADYFIPNNVVALDNADSDFGSGAPIILPDSAGVPGAPHLMLASGKEGTIYVLNRDNLGKYDASENHVVFQTAPNTVGGALSTPAYFNGKVYWLSGYFGGLFQYELNSTTGAISAVAVSPEANLGFLSGSPSISANGTLNGIVWILDRAANVLRAYDATSVATELWASNQSVGGGDNVTGALIKFNPPTVANGQVFVATSNALNVYGLKQPANAVPNAPVLSATALSGSSINLTWTDATVAPNTATSYLVEESADGGQSFSLVTTSPAGATSVAIGGLLPNSTYVFRIRGNNTQGPSPNSNVATATTTSSITGVNYGNGFATSDAPLTYNGSAALNGDVIRLTNGGTNQSSSVFTTSPFDVTGFTTQFQFASTADANSAEGFTFTIQGVGNTALGAAGNSLGFGPVQGSDNGIAQSVAIKFDLANNAGEGSNSTGLYTNGAAPMNAGSIDLTGVPLDFHSGHTFQANMSYLGTTLTVTIKDLTTNVSATQTYSNVQIPTIVGGGTAYIGFTAATGNQSATQDILNWIYQPTAAASPNAPSGLGATSASATSVSLNWTNNAANQTTFILDRADDANFTQNLITQILPATPFTFTDSALGLNPGGTYFYRIRAFNSAGSSANSNVATVTIPVAPPRPTDQVIEEVTDSTISMSWTDNAGHAADGYRILRSVNHGTFTLYATLPLTSRPVPSTYEWTDGDPQNNLSPLIPGTFYEYHIIAYNISGNNDFAGLNATTRLKAPTLIDSQRISSTTASIFFSTDPQATSYNIYRGNSSGTETLLASGVTSSPYVDNTLSAGEKYFYFVTSVNGNAESVPVPNESAPSNEISLPQPPTITSVTPAIGPTTGGTFVLIAGTNFTGVSGAAGVQFGLGSNAASYIVLSDMLIEAITPPHVIGTVDVIVTNNGLTSANTTFDDYQFALPLPGPQLVGMALNDGEMYAINSYGVKIAGLAGNDSIVEQLYVTFDVGVTLAAGAFTLDAGSVTVNTPGSVSPVAAGTNVITILADPDPATLDGNGGYKGYRLRFSGSVAYLNTFDNSPTGSGGTGNLFTTLKDGFYKLNIVGANVHAGNSIAGTPMAGNVTKAFWTMFASYASDDRSISATPGDGSSTISVNSSLIGFAGTNGDGYGAGTLADYNVNFDWNLDGDIGDDLIEFAKRFGAEWTF
jgi:hypothetical protein